MPEEKNYIGVAMGMDVTDLKAGLSEANKQIQLANSEFKAASSGIEDWTKSTDGLTAKVKQLDSILEMQQSKLAGLQAEYEKVVQTQGENSEAARKLKVQINNQQAVVNSTQKEFNNYSTTLEAAKNGTIDLEKVVLKNGAVVKDFADKTTDAEKALKNLSSELDKENNSIKLANSEFELITSTMDDWEKSTEGVKAKVSQLDSVLNAQTNKLNSLEHAYSLVSKEQGENSTEAVKLKTQINNQKAVVNATQQEFDNYSETLKEAESGNIDLTKVTLKNGKALNEQGDSAEKSGKKLDGLKNIGKGVAKGLAVIGTAVAGSITAFLALAESTREFREDMSKLDSAFKGAGLSAESAEGAYKTLFGVIGESDTAVEASQQIALLANSEEDVAKWADVAAGVVGTFGDALKAETFFEAANETIKLGEATGAFTQMLEGTGASVDEFNEGLAACTTEEEKQAYMLEVSNKLLGKAGEAYNETAKDIIEAREAEANLTQAMADLGEIAEPIMTILKNLTADLLREIKPFVELIGNGLKGALEGTAGATDTLTKGIGGLLNMLVEKVSNTIPTILNIVLQLVPQLVETLLNSLPSLLDTIIELTVQVINLLGTLLPDIVSKIIEIVPMLIDSLVAAIPQLIQAAVQFLLAIIDAIPILIEQLLTELPNIIQTILDAVINAVPLLIEAAIQLFNAIIEAIPVIIDSLIKNLPKIINTIVNGLIQALPMVLKAAVQLLTAIIEAIPKILPTLIANLPKIISTIVTVLLENLPIIIQAAIQLFMGIIQAIPEICRELLNNMPQIISAIVTGLKEGLGAMAEAGLNLVKGIWEGIKSGANWLKEKIVGFAGNVAGWFKKTFKINSPSKLMADEIGEYLGEGIGVGVIDSIPRVKKDLSKFSDFVTDNLGNIKSNLSINSDVIKGKNSKGVNNQSNNYQIDSSMTINYNGTLSRKQLKKLENDNDRRIINKLKTGVV